MFRFKRFKVNFHNFMLYSNFSQNTQTTSVLMVTGVPSFVSLCRE